MTLKSYIGFLPFLCLAVLGTTEIAKTFFKCNFLVFLVFFIEITYYDLISPHVAKKKW